MSNLIKTEIENYFINEISRLRSKARIISKAQSKFVISQDAAEIVYNTARTKVINKNRKKSLIYFLLGCCLLCLGIYGIKYVKGVALYSLFILGASSLIASFVSLRIVLKA